MAFFKSIGLLALGTGVGFIALNLTTPNENELIKQFPKASNQAYLPFTKRSERFLREKENLKNENLKNTEETKKDIKKN